MNGSNGFFRGLRHGIVVWMAAMGMAHAAPPPVDSFTRLPMLSEVIPSPSGKRIALNLLGQDGLRKLAVMDTDPPGAARVVAGFTDADVNRIAWVNDDRLVYEAVQRRVNVQIGGGGTFAVNHDGSDPRSLVAWRYSNDDISSFVKSKMLPYGWNLLEPVGDGSGDVFMYRDVWDAVGESKEIGLARMNTLTRDLRHLSRGLPDYTRDVWFDREHQPRAVVAYRSGKSRTYWRSEDEWKLVAEGDVLGSHIEPWYVGGPSELTVMAHGEDTAGLYSFDLSAGKLKPEALFQVKGFNVPHDSVVDSRTHRLMGLHFVADRPISYWFDESMARIQEKVDASLPSGRVNRISCGECETSRFLVVKSSSDRQPGEYYLFDRKSQSLKLIAASRPWIVEATQGRRSFHRFDARDGLKIPLFVTHPADKPADQPLPAIVLVHGGPFVRGSDLRWEDEAQFLASRGYRVLEPEFRGSLGFGYAHFKAGWKQWGLAMQDDLADAVQWAAKQGLVDPKRVCIMGASYGGYAALMGPIAHPGVYRCAASFAGVTDLGLQYTATWGDLDLDSLKYFFPTVMGDPAKDAAQLVATSPARRTAEIKVPILLAHGLKDRRVPVIHATTFTSAAEKSGVKLERIDYPDEGHGFINPQSRADYYRKLEAFFSTHLAEP